MSWIARLSTELDERGVPRRDRRRIVLEFEDHIACEPGCEERLGDPAALASRFADGLATSRARTSAFGAFGGLALAAGALALSQLAIGHAGGYPSSETGLSPALFAVAVLGMLVAPQVALVTGTLAGWRALRRRHERSIPAAEIALIERRSRVALWAGLATVGGIAVYLVNFLSHFPSWYLAAVGAAAALAAVALSLALWRLAGATAIVSSAPGPAGDVYDDVALIRWDWLRRRPWRLGLIASVTVGILATLVLGHAESSLVEGLQRGIFEAVAAFVGYVALGRAVGLFPAV
jgi:hypothetical protein